MKLYVLPGACSLASHIALEEVADWAIKTGATVEPHQVIVVSRGDNFSPSFLAINELGTVPVLETESGQLLSESLAVLMHIADHYRCPFLAPPHRTPARDQLLSLLSYMVSTALPTFQLLWRSERFIELPEHRLALERKAEARLKTIFDHLERRIRGRAFLFDAGPSVADAYLFVLGRWALRLPNLIDALPSLRQFTTTMADRPSVLRAMKTEGIALCGPKTGLG